MDGLKEFLEQLHQSQRAKGHFLGLLHILIGRTISRADGSILSKGVTWRDVATLLRTVRWDPEAVREVGVNPDLLPPRDRQRYWFQTIAQADVASAVAKQAADRLAPILEKAGYKISAASK
jgi:hypothetical protein